MDCSEVQVATLVLNLHRELPGMEGSVAAVVAAVSQRERARAELLYRLSRLLVAMEDLARAVAAEAIILSLWAPLRVVDPADPLATVAAAEAERPTMA